MKETLVCALVSLAAELGTSGVVGLMVSVGALSALVATLGARVQRLRSPGSPAPGPAWLMSVWIAIGLYVAARLIDPLLAHDLGPPPLGVTPSAWERVGYFESVLLGRGWAAPLLPLADHPAVAVTLHAALWPSLIAAIRFIVRLWPSSVRTAGVDVRYETSEPMLPRWWIGATTARRADDRFKRWSLPMLAVLVPLHVTAGGLMAVGERGSAIPQCSEAQSVSEASATDSDVRSPFDEAVNLALGSDVPTALTVSHPSAGAWVLGGLLLLFWILHLTLPGRPSAEPRDQEEDDAENALATEDTPPAALLTRLLAALHDGESPTEAREHAQSLPIETHSSREAQRSALPRELNAMVEPLLAALTANTELFTHQAAVLSHLVDAWRVSPGKDLAETPSLEELVAKSPITRRARSPHALFLAPEASGRSTVAMLAAVHVALDRGGSTLVVVPEGTDPAEWASRLRHAVDRTPARWSVSIAVAGDELGVLLLSDEVPTVVVSDIASLDASVLADPRAEAFLDRLGLIVVDNLDEHIGIAEMHLHLMMRRLWALDDTRLSLMEARGFPMLVLATAGPESAASTAAERAHWARHVLAAPVHCFAGAAGAPCATRVWVEHTDLAMGGGGPPTRAALAQACAEAGLRWHYRRAGDGRRGLRDDDWNDPRWNGDGSDMVPAGAHPPAAHTPATPMTSASTSSSGADVRYAEVVCIEGRYLEVRREARRLALAGSLTEDRTALLVLRSAPDESVVLHQEAMDSPFASQTEQASAWPRPCIAVEPVVLRQRHLERSLGLPHDREALRKRFGPELTDGVLERLESNGRVRVERLHLFDPVRDAPVLCEVVRSDRKLSLGEPIDARCVSDADARVTVLDRATAAPVTRIDAAIAPVRLPPGHVLRTQTGAYVVMPSASEDRAKRRLWVDATATEERTTIERELVVAGPPRFELGVRSVGGRQLPVGLLRVDLEERCHGVRRYPPWHIGRANGTTETEARRFDPPHVARYSSEACLIGLPSTLDHDAAATLVTACRFAIPQVLRASDELADAATVVLDSPRMRHRAADAHDTDAYNADPSLSDRERFLVFFDRLPGGGGFAAGIDREHLGVVLQVARLALERIVGTSVEPFREVWDPSPRSGWRPWRAREALIFLDEILDAPSMSVDRPTRGYAPGEGQVGDLGRLWVAPRGETHRLVWTRHRWVSSVPLRRPDGTQVPLGPVLFDAGIERSMLRDRDPTTANGSLQPFRELLAKAAGDAYLATVLALLAQMPSRATAAGSHPPTPLQTFFSRRGDGAAKARLAAALVEGGQAWVDATGKHALRVGDRFFDVTTGAPTPLAHFDGTPLRAGSVADTGDVDPRPQGGATT